MEFNSDGTTLLWTKDDKITLFPILTEKNSPYNNVKGKYKSTNIVSGAGTTSCIFRWVKEDDILPSSDTGYDFYRFYCICTGTDPDSFTKTDDVYTVKYTLPSLQPGDISNQLMESTPSVRMSAYKYSPSKEFVPPSFYILTTLVCLELKLSDDYTSDEIAISSASISTSTQYSSICGECTLDLSKVYLNTGSATGRSVTVNKEYTLKKGTYTKIYFVLLPKDNYERTTINISLKSKDGSTINTYRDSNVNSTQAILMIAGICSSVQRDVK